MALTGDQLLIGFSKFIGDYWTSTTTGAGTAGGTTLVDTKLARWGDDAIRDDYLRVIEACDTSENEVRRVSSFTSCGGTATVAPAFSGQIGACVSYELHTYDPTEKFRALDAASRELIDELFIIRKDDSITSDGRNTLFDIPSTLDRGPFTVLVEHPIEVDVDENALTNPYLDSTCGWTASCVTASIICEASTNLLVPKRRDSATKLVVAACTNGTYTQVGACLDSCLGACSFNDETLYGGAWVWSTEACKVRLNIIDDAGTTNGCFHGGGGWEWLEVSRTIDGDNGTTLSFQIEVASTANPWTGYAQCAILRAGVIPDFYHEDRVVEFERDDSTQKFWLREPVRRGLQLRLLGKGILTDLGEDACTQSTTSKELDDRRAELLYAKAAQLLFSWDFLNQPGVSQKTLGRIQWAEERRQELALPWPYRHRKGRIVGPFCD